jgi:hypothetical protein
LKDSLIKNKYLKIFENDFYYDDIRLIEKILFYNYTLTNIGIGSYLYDKNECLMIIGNCLIRNKKLHPFNFLYFTLNFDFKFIFSE